MHKFLLAVLALSLCGCATSLSQFQKSDASGSKKNKVALILIDSDEENDNPNPVVKQYIDSNDLLRERIKSECRRPPRPQEWASPAVVPLIGAFGKLLFDLYLDHQIRAAEDLKKAAQVAYSARVQINGAKWSDQMCALFLRYSPETTNKLEPGLVALIRMEKLSNDGFVISPSYILARDAIAVTAKGDTKNKASINLSFSVSVKTIGKQQSGLDGLFTVGEGVFSVPNVSIGADAEPYVCPKTDAADTSCPTSDIVASPTGGDPVSFSLAVTETGKIGVDLDQEVAELKALKEAIGPAVKDSLKEYFK